MPEPRDLWAKVDIVGKVLTPLVIFILGSMYNCHQQKVAEAQKTAERVAILVKSLHSDKSQEKQAAMTLLRLEKQKHPDEVPAELLASTIPTLVELAANDSNAAVSKQAQELITEVTQQVESTVAASLDKTANIPARVYFHILREEQRAAAHTIELRLEQKGWLVPGIEAVKGVPKQTELRYFRRSEESEALAIAAALRAAAVKAVTEEYVSGNEDNKNIRARHFELWFNAEALPLALRSSPRNPLSDDEIKSMLASKDFFDTSSNKDASGLANEYVPQTILGKEVAIDNAANLMWQRGGSTYGLSYGEAEEYIVQLNQSRFAGFSDWRLPTLEEAMSLMEPRKLNGKLYIDSVFDSNQIAVWTSDKVNAQVIWLADFDDGSYQHSGITSGYYVRAVRSSK